MIRWLFCCPRRHTLVTPLCIPSCMMTTYPNHAETSTTDWHLHLLVHVHHHCLPSNTIDLISQSLFATTLLAASNGSAIESSATFGWTLQDKSAPIVTCYGPIHGAHPTLFRAEANGLLSLLTFLSRLLSHNFWITPPPSKSLPVYLDNQSLLTIVTSLPSKLYCSPSETTASEYDLVLQLADILSSIPLHISFFHIKSHQDKYKSTSQLSIPAQANFSADHLATLAQSQCISHARTPI